MKTERQVRMAAAQQKREAEQKKQRERERVRRVMAALFAQRRAAGVCTRCQQPARPGRNECGICAEKATHRVQRRRVEMRA
jgi:recombinational DNA repair protein RecR